MVVGWREWVRLPGLLPANEAIKAKVDTGARTSAIHAWDLARFDRDGQDWVRFVLHPRQNDETEVAAEARVVDERDVRSSNGDTERRLVIQTGLIIGDAVGDIELTLTNRDQMGFRLLLGRTALRGQLVVDPSRSYLWGGNRHGAERA